MVAGLLDSQQRGLLNPQSRGLLAGSPSFATMYPGVGMNTPPLQSMTPEMAAALVQQGMPSLAPSQFVQGMAGGAAGLAMQANQAMPWGGNDPSAIGIDTARGPIDPSVMVPFGTNVASSIVGPGALVPKPTNALNMGIRAWHGSPHDFPPVRHIEMPDGTRLYQNMREQPDTPAGAKILKEYPLGRFDMSKIGTGEGAQTYGHGLYFAENEGVAKQYRDNLGRSINLRDAAFNTDGTPNRAGMVAQNIDAGIAPERTREGLEVLEPDASPEQIDGWLAQGRQMFDEADKAGRMYEVDIDASPDEFLDWDKPLSEQPANVKTVLSEHPSFAGRLDPNDDVVRGEHIIAELGRGDPQNATEALRAAGIKGIRYKDAGSRVDPAEIKMWRDAVKQYEASGDSKLAAARKRLEQLENDANRTHNLVVFDENTISILKKYGIVGLIGSGVGLEAMSGGDDYQ